jgi:hypothetical protein
MDDGLELVHDRDYSVQVYRSSPNELVAVGRVRDEKPAGLYVEHDPDPLTMHDMTIELRVGYPDLVISDASVSFTTFPQLSCPAISDHYTSLVGVSIARGFTHKVRELFGGPRGCAHVTALLQAIAPALVQSTWSMRAINRREGAAGESTPVADPKKLARSVVLPNLDTCHVWAADGELVARVEAGEVVTPGIPVRERLASLGIDWSEPTAE